MEAGTRSQFELYPPDGRISEAVEEQVMTTVCEAWFLTASPLWLGDHTALYREAIPAHHWAWALHGGQPALTPRDHPTTYKRGPHGKLSTCGPVHM